MTTTLSPEALVQLQSAVDNNNAPGYYQILINNGVAYGYLALGAATDGNSGNYWADFGGKFANNFLDQKYYEVHGQNLSESLRQQVREELIDADFKLRTQGPVSSDKIKTYHHEVFDRLNIPESAWTGTFFDSRVNAQSWCWGCGPEELGNSGTNGAPLRLVNSITDFFTNVAKDWSGTATELTAFFHSVAGDGFNGGVLSKTMAEMNFEASQSPLWASFVAALVQAPVLAIDGWLRIFELIGKLGGENAANLSDYGEIAAAFNSAQSFIPPRRDPLVLDLDNDGLETVGPAQSGVLFDHDADGIKTGTGWVKSDDGFLVMDRNNNGVIDNGRELFGDATPLYTGGTAADGFAALAQEDSNGDGKITSTDNQWSNLRIWRDLNQDGISQAGELLTMSNAGIASINVAKTANGVTLANGNQIADLGTYIKTDGSAATAERLSQRQ